MELSPDLISACLALEKYLENPNALTERELVRRGPGPGVPSSPSAPLQLLSRSISLCRPHRDSRIQAESSGRSGGLVLESGPGEGPGRQEEPEDGCLPAVLTSGSCCFGGLREGSATCLFLGACTCL